VSFCEFLAQGWNATALAALAGAVIAIIIEYFPAFQDLPPRTRQLVYMGLCVLGGGGMWGIALWQGCPAVPDWWTVVQAIVRAWGIAFGVGTGLHAVIVALGLGYKAKP
jgi:hypothetical protein